MPSLMVLPRLLWDFSYKLRGSGCLGTLSDGTMVLCGILSAASEFKVLWPPLGCYVYVWLWYFMGFYVMLLVVNLVSS